METINAEISVKFADSKTAEIFFNALYPETLKTFTDRSKISIRKEEDSLEFKIDAKDVTAFRATINSYLIWMRVLHSISAVVDI